MEQNCWLDALIQAKRISNLLNEVLDVTRQMAEAIDRNDQVSLHLLVSMRQDPINQLETADQILRDMVLAVPDPAEGTRLFHVLNGQPAVEEKEQALADQVASNGRRLRQIVALDQVLNKKMAREKSFYRTHQAASQ